MSLSDMDTDQFQPMNVSALERFDEEVSNKTEVSDPDFNRFKALFEKPKFEEEAPFEFKAMYDPRKEAEAVVFTPLIQRKEALSEKKTTVREVRDTKSSQGPEKKLPEAPGETPEEKGYREGFERGLEQGREQGKKQGFEQGFKKGEIQGVEQGEQQGREKGEQQGHEQGLKEGQKKGEAEAREKAVESLAFLEASLKTADQTLALLVDTYEERIISLIQQIAGKVVCAHIELNDETTKQMILDALKTLVQPEEVVLSVSAEDYDYIDMVKDEFFEQIDSLSHVSLRSDPSIKKGGCKIETITASVSADAESRLNAIFDAIKTAGTA